jgi:hypothetical protein
MYLWTNPRPNSVTIDPPSSAAGTYEASGAAFGPPPTTTGVSGNVALVDDGVPPASDGCEPLIGFPAGSIALIDRGNCTFVQKVSNAQSAGATAVIMVNNVPGDPITMGGSDPSITIPSVMVSLEDGDVIKAGLPATGKVASDPALAALLRDGDLDAGIVIHEYGHGISNRLTGGPSIVNCLTAIEEQMGEGWSDWLAIALTALPSESGEQRRGMGTYALFQRDRTGGGIRPTPYSTDMSINPATYDTIKTAAVPHGVGYVWATMLWELFWDLTDKHGFNPNPYGDWTTGGNNLAIQLVMDGMKMQPCLPGFVDGRDAILAADRALTGGQNQCVIWRGFAKRGLGFSAIQGTSASRTDNFEAFDTHPSCPASASVEPTSLSSSQPEGTVRSSALTIRNEAPAGSDDLSWHIREAETDCSSPSDLPWVSASPASGLTSPQGSTSVAVRFDATEVAAPGDRSGKLCIRSNDGSNPVIEVDLSMRVVYPFSGFFGAAGPPALNDARAGNRVSLSFSLGGDRGFGFLAAGSPSSQQIDCASRDLLGTSAPAMPLGAAGLSYNRGQDRYTYRWETSGAWKGQCRQFTLSLNDGTEHVAHFRFR